MLLGAVKRKKDVKVTVVIGIQRGDEAKGAVTDRYCATGDYDYGIRFSGSWNTGRNIRFGGKFFNHHLMPSCVHHNMQPILGSGMAIPPWGLLQESIELTEAGAFVSNLLISSRAKMLMPWHVWEDELQEEERGSDKVGTTLSGVGPCYRDHVDRPGLLFNLFCSPWETVEAVIKRGLDKKIDVLRKRYENFDPQKAESDFPWIGMKDAYATYQSCIIDLPSFLRKALEDGKSILGEGSQGALLDIDYGMYPYVTSAHVGTSGFMEGTGLNPVQITEVVGVLKGYQTKVGAGPFPSRMIPEIEEIVREEGKEFGQKTGRPRECGWLDFPQLLDACQSHGVTGLAVVKIDIMHKFPVSDLQYVDAYRYRNEKIYHIPVDLENIQPLWKTIPKWDESIDDVEKRSELPDPCEKYLKKIEERCGVPIIHLGKGPNREDVITV